MRELEALVERLGGSRLGPWGGGRLLAQRLGGSARRSCAR